MVQICEQAPVSQLLLAPQLCEADQSRQPFSCVAQTWKLEPETQRRWFSVHWLVQLVAHAPPEQVWPDSHITAELQRVQPSEPTAQVWTPFPAHWVSCGVHSLMQPGPASVAPSGIPGGAEQAPTTAIRKPRAGREGCDCM